MIEGFDKEIDAILRQARGGDFASAVGTKSDHLDADDLSAFADNALPEKTKQFYTQHLADCSRCRKILSTLISFNAEAEIEAASSAVAEPKKNAEIVIPWYRKLFLFPQLTYTMGACVLIFSGFLAYLFVQNSARNSDSSEVSQIRERPQNMSGASSDGETTSVEISRSNANTVANMSNSSSVSSSSNSTMMSNAASNAASSNSASNVAAAPRREQAEREKDLSAARNDELAKAENQPMPVAAAPPPPPASSLADSQSEESRVVDDKKKTTKKSESETKKPAGNLAINTDSTAGASVMRSSPAPKMMPRKMDASETKQSGGRSFTRKDGVWYDSNYKGQSTTNILRGSDDFKKLDSGLRSIADSLSGTVVIVWKNKAYRIQ